MKLSKLLFEQRTVEVYHASPEAGITKFQPRWSPAYKQSGLFVSPTKRAVINSWADWALGAKGRDKGPLVPSAYANYKKQRQSSGQRFQNVTIYTLRVPQEAVDAATELAKTDQRGYWDEELFIPEEWIDQVEIVGRSTLTKNQIRDTQHRFASLRGEGIKTATRAAEEVKDTNPAAALYLEITEQMNQLALKGKLSLPAVTNTEESKAQWDRVLGLRSIKSKLDQLFTSRSGLTVTSIETLSTEAGQKLNKLRDLAERYLSELNAPRFPASEEGSELQP